jgi:prevent-host-death family protein
MVLKESMVAQEAEGLVVNVRAAKDQLSSLLEKAAQGNEVIITSDGLPKAKLVPVRAQRRTFKVDWALLDAMPVVAGTPKAEELVRQDRDGRA